MTQIADQIGVHKSRVHRLLATLERRRFVQRDAVTGTYQLGIRLFQMAYLTLEHSDLSRLASPFLRRLCEQHRKSVHRSVLDDTDVVYVNMIEGPQRVKLAASIGQRPPALATAFGKAILAFIPHVAVQRTLDRGMPQYTSHTPLSPAPFFEAMRQVQARGFALSEQEFEWNQCCRCAHRGP